MSQQHTLYKLIILYMLRKLDFPLTQSQISDFVLGKEYTDYFTLQTSITELEESRLVDTEARNNLTYYSLTKEGEETIGFFENRIPQSIRSDIMTYIQENKLQMRDDSSVHANYYRNTEGGYDIQCSVKEMEQTLIDLTLSFPTEDQAKKAASRWKEKCQEIYAYVMGELLTNNERNE